MLRYPASHAFPVTRQDGEHIGEVYDELSRGAQVDLDIIARTPANKKCVPPG